LKFVVDSMLGKLAKWLRIMGIDTHYQSYYMEDAIARLIGEGRCLLSKHKPTVELYMNSVLISSDRVGEQLVEMKEKTHLPFDRAEWFSRCLICNVPLEDANMEEARDEVPEYVFHNVTGIRYCPTCNRYFWPGSHRKRMVQQLQDWGF